LILFCLLLCPAIFLLGIGLIAVAGGLAAIVVMVAGFAIPLLAFFLLRRRASDTVVATLGDDFFEIRSPGNVDRVLVSNIQHASSAFADGMDEKSVAIVVEKAGGGKIKLFASTALGKIESMRALKKDFDEWVRHHGLVQR
jgi:hypothetical protein